jgi:subtilisin family serine protease
MGEKYLIIVKHEFMRGAEVAQMSARAPLNSARSQSPLAARRIALTQLARELVAPTPNEALGAVTALNSVQLRPRAAAAAPTAVPNVDVLEGIGGLVVDESDVDVQSLDGVAGLEVFPNRDIEMISPVASSAAAGPSKDWHLKRVRAPYKHTGKGVLIGVLDTGIDAAHPEFAGKKIHFQEFDRIGRKVSSTPRDAGSHGTHVCGIATGATCGVAPGADLAVAAVLTVVTPRGHSGSLIQIASGLNWLLVNNFRRNIAGVDVVNASLGVGVPAGGSKQTGYDAFLYQIVKNAQSAPGVLMIASIGNDGTRGDGFHGSPGNYETVVGVGATDIEDKVADFSDWDTQWKPPGTPAPLVKPDLCAPGVEVYSSVPGGKYQRMSGTSMASPVIAGAAAALLEEDPALRGNPTKLQAALIAKATCAVNPSARGGVGLFRL